MPTEHEFKFVLEVSTSLKTKIEKLAKKIQYIEQGYLCYSKGNSLRVRTITDQKTRWFLTFKQKVATRVIEIENKIDSRDGIELWNACIGKLKKSRYVMPGKPKWEVDFFYDHIGHLYFCMAEVELAEGSDPPEKVPDYLKEHLIYEVPLTDDRFSNKRLSDVEYATKLYHSIRKENTNGCKV